MKNYEVVMEKAICPECGEECEVVLKDFGSYEEFWGFRVWNPYELKVSMCCGKEIE